MILAAFYLVFLCNQILIYPKLIKWRQNCVEIFYFITNLKISIYIPSIICSNTPKFIDRKSINASILL